MSLMISSEVAAKAREGHLSSSEFLACVRESLPDAWDIVSGLVRRKYEGESGLVQHAPTSMDEKVRGQLLRMMASTAIRTALENNFGITLAFQNCHIVAVFWLHEVNAYQQFTSLEAQILNQIPERVDC